MALCFQEEKNIIKSMEQLMVDQLNQLMCHAFQWMISLTG